MKIWDDFIAKSIKYIQLNPERVRICLNKLSEEQVWAKPVESANSIGNLILHLQGNVNQYIASGLGGEKDMRNRDWEFEASQVSKKKELEKNFENCLNKACKVLKGLHPEQLQAEYELQGFHLTGTDVVIHVTEHLSYHVGQIALLTKLMVNEDLGFYSDRDLNIKNKEKK